MYKFNQTYLKNKNHHHNRDYTWVKNPKTSFFKRWNHFWKKKLYMNCAGAVHCSGAWATSPPPSSSLLHSLNSSTAVDSFKLLKHPLRRKSKKFPSDIILMNGISFMYSVKLKFPKDVDALHWRDKWRVG